jgi:hypothetical protein
MTVVIVAKAGSTESRMSKGFGQNSPLSFGFPADPPVNLWIEKADLELPRFNGRVAAFAERHLFGGMLAGPGCELVISKS